VDGGRGGKKFAIMYSTRRTGGMRKGEDRTGLILYNHHPADEIAYSTILERTFTHNKNKL